MAAVWLTPDAPIGAVVRRPTVMVTVAASIGDTARTMRDANVSAVLVEDAVTIVTERDLTVALAAGLCADDPVAAIGTHEPLRVPARMSIVDTARTMVEQRVRHLVIAFPDEPDGVVSLRDVVVTLIRASDPVVATIALRQAGLVSTDLWIG